MKTKLEEECFEIIDEWLDRLITERKIKEKVYSGIEEGDIDSLISDLLTKFFKYRFLEKKIK